MKTSTEDADVRSQDGLRNIKKPHLMRTIPTPFPTEQSRASSTKDERDLEIADWLCQHACSFVLFDTKVRATVIGFECEEDGEACRREFCR